MSLTHVEIVNYGRTLFVTHSQIKISRAIFHLIGWQQNMKIAGATMRKKRLFLKLIILKNRFRDLVNLVSMSTDYNSLVISDYNIMQRNLKTSNE